MSKKTCWLALTIAVMIIIFAFSNQGRDRSHEISNAIAEKINITPTYESQEISEVPLVLGLNIRNLAHVALYLLLGMATAMWMCSWWRAGLICCAYACFDELHQLMVVGRRANIIDILIDSIGFGIAILIWLFVSKILKKLE